MPSSSSQNYPGAPSHPGQHQQPLLDPRTGQPSTSSPQADAHVVYMNGSSNSTSSSSTGNQQRTKKQALGSVCCGIVLLLILLLTFLLPRSPSIELTGGDLYLSGYPITVNASFRFTNRNFYKTTYSNLHFGLYTLSDMGQIGEASYTGPIEVHARKSKVINVGIVTPKGTGLNIQHYCKSNPSLLMYLANATVEATSQYKDFGSVGVYSPLGALFMCQQPPPSSSGEE